MADISKIARILAGATRNVDLASNTLAMQSIKIGASLLEIKETAGHFDFSGKKLTNVADPTSAQDVATKSYVDNSSGAASYAIDSIFEIRDDIDNTKKIKFEAAGISTGTTRIIGMPDYNVSLGDIANKLDTASFTDAAVTGKFITGFVSGAGSVSATDTILQAIQKLDGNTALKLNSSAFTDTAVTSKLITGFVSGAGTVSSADSILQAIQKLDGNFGGLFTSKVNKSGDTMSGNLAMGGNKVTGLGAATTNGDAVRYEQAILAAGTNAFSGDQSMGGHKLTNLSDPTSAQDAVTLNYLSARLSGLSPKQSVRAASTGSDITLASALVNGFVLDGVTLATGDRVLVKDQSTPSQNGIYIVAASGAASRATDFDSVGPIDEVNGAWVAVQNGTVNAGKVFIQYGVVVTLGTDAVNFEYFNPIAGLIGGDMITFSSSTFNVDLATSSGLKSTNPGNVAGQLMVQVEATNPSLAINGSNELGVATGGITNTHISATAAIVYSKLNLASSIVNADISATAAIAYSKLNLAGSIVNADISASAAIAYSKLNLAASIVNADIASGAAIAESKLALGYSTSSLNTAIGTKVSKAGDTMTGDLAMSGNKVTGLGTPTLSGDAATKGYVDGAISGGASASAGLIKKTMVAGEAFAANTSFLVRYAITGETAGRVYKTIADSTSANKFHAIGIVMSTSAVSAGGNIDVIMLGSQAQGSSDTPWASGDVGQELFVGPAGSIILGSSLTNAALEAQFCIGVVESTTSVFFHSPQLRGIA